MKKLLRGGRVLREDRSFSRDCPVLIEEGRILAVGSHEELLNSSPEYRKTVELQKLDEEKEGA